MTDDRRAFLFSGRQHPTHNWRVQLVLAFSHLSSIILYPHYEDGQIAFLVEGLVGDGRRQNAVETMIAISGLIAMASDVPGEYADLVEVERHAVFVLGEQHQVLWHLFLAVGDLVENQRSHRALAFGV